MSDRKHNDINDARRLEIFDRHRGRVFSVAYGMLGEVAEAEDAVQDAYLRCQGLTDEQFRKFRKVRSPEDYLASVVLRL